MTESAPRQASLSPNAAGSSIGLASVLRKNQSAEAVIDIAFGSIAGIISKIFEYPFDTIKVRLQSQSIRASLRYDGPVDCFQKSLRADGVSGLYRGISAPMLGAALETSSLFFSYRVAKDLYRTIFDASSREDPLPLGALVTCGAASGAFTSLILTPVELVKCQMQVSSDTLYHRKANIRSIMSAVYRSGGISGFWHGQTGTLIRETGGSAAWFGSYEAVTAFFRLSSFDAELPLQQPLAIWQQLIAGASAGICYNFIFYPADTIKSRMQTDECLQGSRSVQAHGSFVGTGRQIWRQHGLKGLYRGCGITVARAAPSSAMIFSIYEGLSHLAAKPKDD